MISISLAKLYYSSQLRAQMETERTMGVLEEANLDFFEQFPSRNTHSNKGASQSDINQIKEKTLTEEDLNKNKIKDQNEEDMCNICFEELVVKKFFFFIFFYFFFLF